MKQDTPSSLLATIGLAISFLTLGGVIAIGSTVSIAAPEWLMKAEPVLIVWRPAAQRMTLGEPKLRFAVWSNGQVAVSYPLGSLSATNLYWGSIPVKQVSDLKSQIKKTGVFEIRRLQYLLFEGSDCRLRVNIDGNVRELRWGETDAGAESFGAKPEEFDRFKQVWQSVHDIMSLQLATSLLPASETNGVPLQGSNKVGALPDAENDVELGVLIQRDGRPSGMAKDLTEGFERWSHLGLNERKDVQNLYCDFLRAQADQIAKMPVKTFEMNLDLYNLSILILASGTNTPNISIDTPPHGSTDE